jgi:hypothetical protein
MPEYNQELCDYVNSYKDDYGRPKVVILLNTERSSESKNYVLEKYKFIDCYYFFHAFAAADWYRGYQYCNELVPVHQRKIKKKFITFNRITGKNRVYRSFFVAELAKRNLIDQGYISYSTDCPEHGSYKEHILNSITTFNIPEQYAKDSIEIINKITHPLRIDKDKHFIPNGSQTLSAISQCMESFLHVVTETCFWENKEHLTEKIFKPIVSKQPFLLLGCPNNLAYLKSYGFKTFDAWWDESYDLIQDPIKRIQAVTNIIEDIAKMPNEDLEAMLRGMSYVLEYNYNRFYSKEFLDEVWGELTDNLKDAIAQFRLQISQETQLPRCYDILDYKTHGECLIDI